MARPFVSRFSSLFLAAAVLLAACQGVVGAPDSLEDGPLTGGDGDGDGDGDDGAAGGGAGGDDGATGTVVPEPLHRLNGLEYDNTVRDLLATTLTPSRSFPPDTVEGGFDNAADGLTLTPAQMDLYATSARELAAATLQTAPRFTSHVGARQHAEATSQAGNAFDWGWSMPRFGGSLAFSLETVEDEVVTFSILAGGDAVGMPTPEMGLNVDGVEVGRWVVTATPTAPAVYTVQVAVTAGAHALAITFPNGADQPADNVYNTLVVGYLDARSEAMVTPAGRALVYECEPSAVADPVGCYRHIVTRFAERAWRRPLDDDEREAIFALWEELRIAEGDDAAVELVVRAVLVSSKFLYRASFAASPSDGGEEGTLPLDDYTLASRLSYFLWSSMPDDELLAEAEAGALRGTDGLRSQVTRMLADPRAAGLRKGFASQWLSTRILARHAPDPAVFPGFDESLRASMIEEAELFFEDFLTNGMRVGDMMTPDFGYLNDRLATHYGVPLPGSDAMVRVDLGEGDRRGLVMQGAWLTATSASTRTSPVNRGRWILEQLLCNAVPPPPPDVPLFMDPAEGETVREVLAQHRENPVCAGCHDLLDPAGLGMEGFDGVGVARDTENGAPIDTTGAVPTDLAYDGAAELAEILADDSRFVGCLTEKLFTYAMGRARVLDDDAFIEAIEGQLAADDGALDTLLELVVASPAFRTRPMLSTSSMSTSGTSTSSKGAK